MQAHRLDADGDGVRVQRGCEMRKQRSPEILWGAATVARAFDVTPERLMCLVRFEAIPKPVLLRDTVLWRAADLRAWAKALGASEYTEAVAALWAEYIEAERIAAGVQKGGVA